ncbi:MAG: Rab family GTPase [Legionella sp.]
MEQKQEYDEHYKIIILGDNCVGKSCLLQSYFGGDFDLYYYVDTYDVDQKIKLLRIFDKTIRLRIWDASGAPNLKDLIAQYIRLADGSFICFDVTNTSSFRNVKTYVERFKANGTNAPMILIGCKSDEVKQRKITYTEAQELAEELGLPYLEVSSLKKINLNEWFEQMAQ